ncbi:HCN4 [Symbiodinium natans]|uniref:HCN4 protein n=1 Tax=Symbiodinium natans TaxID=878477 RepID=A0A812R1M6_9DINO|nr:HCN4 [Symbiodinium natans]
MAETGQSLTRRLSLQVTHVCSDDGERRPSFLRKTVSTAIRGNEARQKWRMLEKAGSTSEDLEPGPPVGKTDSRLGSKLSVAAADSSPRRGLRTTSSAVFDAAFSGKDILSDVPLFKDCTFKFLEALSAQVHTRLVEPGTDIYLEGEQGDSLFFLCRGEVEVLHGGEVQSKHQDGAVFGEMAAASKHPALTTRSATVRASTLCDFKLLQRDDLQQVLSHFKEDAKRLEEKVERHMEELREKGAIPARKEWWRMDARRSSVASIASATSEGRRPSVWKRALSGVTRRMSLTHKPHAYTLATTAMAGLTGLASTAPPALRNRGRRMSDGMLLVRQERQASKSSITSLKSICEGQHEPVNEDASGRTSSPSSSSSSSSSRSGSSHPEWAMLADDTSEPGEPRRSRAESLEIGPAEAQAVTSHSALQTLLRNICNMERLLCNMLGMPLCNTL